MKPFIFCSGIALIFFSCNSPGSADQKPAAMKPDSAATTGSAPTEAAEKPAAPVVHSDTLCFEKRFKKDLNTVQLVMTGDSVTGTMIWAPWEKDGAAGTLAGKKSGDIITALYAYTIEGNDQKEEVVFKISANELTQKIGPLMDKNGVEVMKDPAKAAFKEIYKKVDCKNIVQSGEK